MKYWFISRMDTMETPGWLLVIAILAILFIAWLGLKKK